MNAGPDGIPYSEAELTSCGPRPPYRNGHLREIAFPLGGIGTGCISLGGYGQLRDWEVFNRPDQGYRPEFSFVALRAQAEAGPVVTKVVQALFPPPYGGPFGSAVTPGLGLPHFTSNTFRGEYPFAWLDFEDEQVPLNVSLEAFSPFIPLDERDSGLPVAILTYRLKNRTEQAVCAFLTITCQNPVGRPPGSGAGGTSPGGNRNRFRCADGLNGMVMDSAELPEDHPRFGSIVMATPWPDVTYTGRLGTRGFTVGHCFWDAVHCRGKFDNADLSLGPGESAEVTLLLAWYFPNYALGLPGGQSGPWSCEKGGDKRPQWKNWYATQFADAWGVAAYVGENLQRLRGETMAYHDALFGSTLPAVVLDAASSQTSTLKTCTCLRLEDGTFYGFEGCGPASGCCTGSCTHVWNYQQALPFLFPALERSMRTADYRYNLREEDGRMCFRIGLPLGTSHWSFHPCVDGQLGGVMKTYRDWLLCGDDDWLRALWPRVKKALAYTWEEWDADRDGVIDGVQHNTYDIEFQGPNPLSGAFYMGALRAAEEMARYLGEDAEAKEYRALFERGSARLDELVFNGEYYYQLYDPQKVSTQQFGEGCLSDQMLGQWLAAICGLGYLFRPENVRSALHAVFCHNWRASLKDHPNAMRIYAIGGDAGLLMASWPRGNRPLVPTMYSDEVWTGIEYQVASHLILEGCVREGLTIVKGARDRHDGLKRNPWDEAECGSHYARAMSSWGLILALSGYFCNSAQGLLQFAPAFRAEDFRCIWSSGTGWGVFTQKLGEGNADVTLRLLGGHQALSRLRLRPGERCRNARAEFAGRDVGCSSTADGDWLDVVFTPAVRLGAGQTLTVTLSA
jgi:non-lysosomal glucosylceramidase